MLVVAYSYKVKESEFAVMIPSLNFPALKCMAAVAALVCLTASASADVVNVTYTGTVSSVGYANNGISNNPDVMDLFGGGYLNGDSFTLSFTFDTSLVSLSTSPGSQSFNVGGLPDPFLSTTLAINGITQSIVLGTGNNYYGGTAATSGNGLNDLVTGTSGIYNASAHASIGTTINATPVAPGLLATPVELTNPGCGNGCSAFGEVDIGSEGIYLDPSLVVVSDVAVTPLPSSWPLFAAGLGILGLIGFRSTKKNTLPFNVA